MNLKEEVLEVMIGLDGKAGGRKVEEGLFLVEN